ncbi:hypothetical protein RND81_03G143700 [Saponaria officinalis]|uniref:K Homology domain-containing protein n=2 Tax=Saponaria officinalis TaxID=3572 RepID=A0AAW1M0G0_SAPOF
MADEARYDAHKRKYDEDDTLPPPPPRRRATGFSDGPPAGQAPPQYGSVPPPVDEFAAIKQNIQQLASRALGNSNINTNNSSVDANKRSKFDDNTPAYSSNYSSYSDQKSSGNQYGSAPSSAHGYSGASSRKIEIPNARVGVIIGKSGETIKYLQNQSGARIQITRDSEHDPHAVNRQVELMGTQDQIARAEQLIHDVIAEADTGGPGSVSRKVPSAPGAEQFVMKVASNKVGLVIGKGGETIKGIQARSGAKVQVIPLHPPPGDMSMERTVQIDGTSEQIEIAKQMVYEVTENRNRNPSMGGGYPQQSYQARPPSNWAPQPPQAQQAAGGYGYMQQPGAYPGAQSQYTQQPYSGYPPQTAPGAYSQNWDQSGAPQTQQAPQGSGYDYYGQQQPPTQPQHQPSGAPADASGYNYNQPPTSGPYSQQGYSQDGYAGGYQAPGSQSGYGQTTENPQSGYDQQHGYGNATNTQSQDGNPSSYSAQGETGQAPQQGYPTGYGVAPTSQPGYPTAQGGYGSAYGQPQGQKTPTNPPAYGQPQQSPSQAGYGQPATAQPGYPPSQASAQPGYAQPAAPAYGGSTTPPGTYPPPYGAPHMAPPSYGQQPPYYGGAYSQPPAYPAEGNGTAAAATPSPASQPAAQPAGAAKRSP